MQCVVSANFVILQLTVQLVCRNNYVRLIIRFCFLLDHRVVCGKRLYVFIYLLVIFYGHFGLHS